MKHRPATEKAASLAKFTIVGDYLYMLNGAGLDAYSMTRCR